MTLWKKRIKKNKSKSDYNTCVLVLLPSQFCVQISSLIILKNMNSKETFFCVEEEKKSKCFRMKLRRSWRRSKIMWRIKMKNIIIKFRNRKKFSNCWLDRVPNAYYARRKIPFSTSSEENGPRCWEMLFPGPTGSLLHW